MTDFDSKICDLHAKRAELLAESETLETRRDGNSKGIAERQQRIVNGLDKIDVEIEALTVQERARVSQLVVSDGIRIESGSASGPTLVSRFSGDPWNASETFEVRDRAMYALERLGSDGTLTRTAGAVEKVTRTLEGRDGPVDVDVLSKWTATVSDPEYRSAFVKVLRDPETGHREWSNGELNAFQRSRDLQRAMTLTSNQGGYLAPFQLDPSVIGTSDGSYNEVRKAARVVVAVSNTWNGVSSAGVTGSWDNEAVEVSDDSATFAQPTITICKEQIFVPISIEALMDEMNVAQEVADQISFEADRLESIAFVTGSGTNQPQGIVTALSGGSSQVNTTSADTFSLVDLYSFDGALPARYRFRASWLAHRKIYNAVRQFDTSGGAALWAELGADVPQRLLGKPAYEAEGMASAVSGTNNKFLIFGDFNNYVIADRIGTTIELVPHLFGASGRPTGQRGFFCFKRVGADSVNDGAFRMLNGQ